MRYDQVNSIETLKEFISESANEIRIVITEKTNSEVDDENHPQKVKYKKDFYFSVTGESWDVQNTAS